MSTRPTTTKTEPYSHTDTADQTPIIDTTTTSPNSIHSHSAFLINPSYPVSSETGYHCPPLAHQPESWEAKRVLVLHCSYCHLLTLSLPRLLEHLMATHAEEAPECSVYQCSRCSLISTDQNLLREHAQVWHAEDRQVSIRCISQTRFNTNLMTSEPSMNPTVSVGQVPPAHAQYAHANTQHHLLVQSLTCRLCGFVALDGDSNTLTSHYECVHKLPSSSMGVPGTAMLAPRDVYTPQILDSQLAAKRARHGETSASPDTNQMAPATSAGYNQLVNHYGNNNNNSTLVNNVVVNSNHLGQQQINQPGNMHRGLMPGAPMGSGAPGGDPRRIFMDLMGAAGMATNQEQVNAAARQSALNNKALAMFSPQTNPFAFPLTAGSSHLAPDQSYYAQPPAKRTYNASFSQPNNEQGLTDNSPFLMTPPTGTSTASSSPTVQQPVTTSSAPTLPPTPVQAPPTTTKKGKKAAAAANATVVNSNTVQASTTTSASSITTTTTSAGPVTGTTCTTGGGSAESVFVCNTCGHSYSNKKYYNEHVLCCGREDPFQCVCGHLSKWRSNLYAHRKRCSVYQKSTRSTPGDAPPPTSTSSDAPAYTDLSASIKPVPVSSPTPAHQPGVTGNGEIKASPSYTTNSGEEVRHQISTSPEASSTVNHQTEDQPSDTGGWTKMSPTSPAPLSLTGGGNDDLVTSSSITPNSTTNNNTNGGSNPGCNSPGSQMPQLTLGSPQGESADTSFPYPS